MRRSRRSLVLVTLAALAHVPTAPLHAQQISGTLKRSLDSLPVVGALVILSDSTGHDVMRTISSERGRFLFDAPAGGAYRLRVLRIGMRPFGPHAVSVPASGRVPVELFIRDVPVELAAVTVAGRTSCGIPPDNSILGTLLTEARKALTLTEATLEERRFLFVIETWQRRQARDLTTIDSVPTVSVDRGWPIRSAPSESLRVWGFVKGARDSLGRETMIDYYGPDAHVLFDDWFLTSHCLRVTYGPSPGQIALAFRPERLRNNVDISGRFVFDSSSLALRELSWRWEGLPHWVPDNGQGGFVRFEAMPSGGWLPTAWSLRAPIEAVDRQFGPVLGEFAEFGGRVAARSDRADSAAALAALLHTPAATISGTVTDTSGRSVGDARVSIGSGNSVVADSAGRFRLDATRPGTHILHAQAVGYAPAEFAVRVAPDSTLRVAIQLTPRPITLDTVTVSTTPENVVGLQINGFYERRRERLRGAGTSSFVTPEQIEQRRPQHVTDLLAQLPGVHVQADRDPGFTGRVLVAFGRRFGCAMAIWVDGALVKTPTTTTLGRPFGGIAKDVPGGIDGYLTVNQVAAIEVYQTASEVPAQFNIVDNQCGTIVIWTGSRR